MVTIIGYALRTNQESKEFFALILNGGIELAKSKETERFYATSKKASIPSTFDEETCKSLIGQSLPGSIKKVECDPYELTLKETGKIITLNYRWEYQSEAESAEEAIHEGKVLQSVEF